MNCRFARRLLPAAALSALLCCAGCYTDSTGRTVFGRRPTGPTPEQLREARIRALESQLSQLQSELDGVGTSVNTVALKSDQLTRASDARGADTIALRRDLEAMQERLTALEQSVKQVPSAMQSALTKEHRAIVAEVNKALSESDARINRQLKEISRKASAPRTAAASSGRFYEHTVESGQTLSEIARAYGVSQSVIARENNISDPAKIRVGQILLIPAP